MPETITVGDRIQFDADTVAGEGFVLAIMQQPGTTTGVAYLGVLGLPHVLQIPLQFCRVLERGALVRKVESVRPTRG